MAHIDASTGERSGNTFPFPRYAQGRGGGQSSEVPAIYGDARLGTLLGHRSIERGRCTALSGALHGRFMGRFAPGISRIFPANFHLFPFA